MEIASYDNLLALVRELQAEVAALREENRRLREENAALKAENERLRKGPASPPAFVKPSRPKPPEGAEGKGPRKRRTMGFGRGRETPTREEEHKLERCPDCDGPVSLGSEKRRRQVIEIPECPVEVVDHVIRGHWCGYCNKEQVARVSPAAIGAVGEGRLGARLRSLVVLLREEGRLPFGVIRRVLSAQYGVRVSLGEVVEIVHAAARAGEGEAEAILEQLRSAPVVHGDETGWRQDGRNGYLWSFCTPEDAAEPLRYYRFEESRAGAVVEAALDLSPSEGKEFGGVLVSDFYSAYNVHLGRHQRCWVHLLRDLHELKEKHPDDREVQAWAEGVKAVYQAAKAWEPEHPGTRFEGEERRAAQLKFEARLRELARPYRETPEAPPHVLCKRIERFLSELFVFVTDPRVPSDNNAAERSLRPCVIARKISGGTRSEKGSKTRTTLMTLFGTWKLQGKDLLETCRQMLLSSSLPQPQAA